MLLFRSDSLTYNGRRVWEVAPIQDRYLQKLLTIKFKTMNSDTKPSEQSPIHEVTSSAFVSTGTLMRFITPLEMRWKPKEDITTYELAKCLPYLIRYNAIMPYEIDKTEVHFRHFEIIDLNR